MDKERLHEIEQIYKSINNEEGVQIVALARWALDAKDALDSHHKEWGVHYGCLAECHKLCTALKSFPGGSNETN